VSGRPTSGDESRDRNYGRLSSYLPLKREDILSLHRLGKLSREQLATWERMRRKVRNRILSLVRQGRLSPAKAEGWTQKRGEESFETPDRAKLGDPMSLPNWTLAMATAWIIWRSPDAVRESWNDYRCECYGWERIPIGGGAPKKMAWELRRLPPVSRSTVRSLAFRQEDPANQIEAPTRACDLLDHKLQSGAVEATGIPDEGTGRRVRIPPHEWIDFSFVYDDDEHPESVFSTVRGKPHYREVRVRVGDLMREWPPNLTVDFASSESNAVSRHPDESQNNETAPTNIALAAVPSVNDARQEIRAVKEGSKLRSVGKPRTKGDGILAEMRKMDRLELSRMTEKDMEYRFEAVRSTCRNYRKQVLAENGDN
jgi:hypothetical protein